MAPEPPDAFLARFRAAGGTHPWTERATCVACAGSSNDVALDLARQGAPHGTSVTVLDQTSGRGRQGRTWDARPGDSLCLSVILRPDNPAADTPRLTLAVGLAVHRALADWSQLPLTIKWPNDILWEDRKLAGILCEGGVTQGRMDYAIAGIGLNLNQGEKDFPPELRGTATSLALLSNRAWDAAEAAARILHSLHTVLEEDWDRVLASWKAACASIGRPVRVRLLSGDLQGVLEDVEADGAIRFRPHHGPAQRLLSAEIL